MSQFTIYVIIITAVSLFGLFYTYRLAQNQKSKYDTKVNEHVEAHPYTLNPVFITYIVAIVLSLGYLLYVAFKAGAV